MTVTFNSESYDQAKVHTFFNQGREAIKSHGIPDEHCYISKALTYTELATHLLGSFADINDFIQKP